MTSSNGNIFCVTGPSCGEFISPGEFPTQKPVTQSFDVFFDPSLNKQLSKQPWGWWFETLSWSLRRHCNECMMVSTTVVCYQTVTIMSCLQILPYCIGFMINVLGWWFPKALHLILSHNVRSDGESCNMFENMIGRKCQHIYSVVPLYNVAKMTAYSVKIL